MRFMYKDGRYGSTLSISGCSYIDSWLLDTGSQFTVIRRRVLNMIFGEQVGAAISNISKNKPTEAVGFGGMVVNLYPALLSKVCIGDTCLDQFICYVDIDRDRGNNVIGSDIISSCNILHTVGDYCIDIDSLNFNKYVNKFLSDYRKGSNTDINSLDMIYRADIGIEQPSNPYLDDLLGAASAALGK